MLFFCSAPATMTLTRLNHIGHIITRHGRGRKLRANNQSLHPTLTSRTLERIRLNGIWEGGLYMVSWAPGVRYDGLGALAHVIIQISPRFLIIWLAETIRRAAPS